MWARGERSQQMLMKPTEGVFGGYYTTNADGNMHSLTYTRVCLVTGRSQLGCRQGKQDVRRVISIK